MSRDIRSKVISDTCGLSPWFLRSSTYTFGEGESTVARALNCNLTLIHHSVQLLSHAGSKGTPVSRRAEHSVKHSQRCNTASPAKGQGRQFHSPVEFIFQISQPSLLRSHQQLPTSKSLSTPAHSEVKVRDVK